MQNVKSAKRSFKRVLSLMLALILVVAILPTTLTVSAAVINWYYDGDIVTDSPLDKNQNSYAFSNYWDVVSSSKTSTIANKSAMTGIQLKNGCGSGDVLILLDTTDAALAQKAFTKMNFYYTNSAGKIYYENDNLRLEQIYYNGLGRNVFAIRCLGQYPEYPQVTLAYNKSASSSEYTRFTATVINPGKDFSGSWLTARGEAGVLVSTKYSVVEDEDSGAMVVKAVYTYNSRTGHNYDFSPVEYITANGSWTSGSLVASNQESQRNLPQKYNNYSSGWLTSTYPDLMRFSNLIVGNKYTDAYYYTNADIMNENPKLKSASIKYTFYPGSLKTVQYADTKNGVFSWKYEPSAGTLTFYVSNDIFTKYIEGYSSLTGEGQSWKHGGTMLLWQHMYDVLQKINSACGESFTALPLPENVAKITIYIGATKAYEKTAYFTEVYGWDTQLPIFPEGYWKWDNDGNYLGAAMSNEQLADVNNYAPYYFYATTSSYWYEAMIRASKPANCYNLASYFSANSDPLGPSKDSVANKPNAGTVPQMKGW